MNESTHAVTRRYVTAFLGTLVVLLAGTSILVHISLYDYRADSFDFRRVGELDVVALPISTRQQQAGLKVGFAEAHQPPKIGLFGNHQVQLARSEALQAAFSIDPVDEAMLFFNYQYENMTLVDVYHYMHHLSSLNQLPTELAIVAITTPNNDNGQYIVERSREMPFDINFASDTYDIWGALANTYHVAISVIQYHLDYASLITAIRQRDQEVFVGSLERALATPGIVRMYRSDGSGVLPFVHYLRQNENALEPEQALLQPGDELTIAAYMRRIADLADSHGIGVVFLIPPVFETDRESDVNTIFSEALGLVPELKVIDHRYQHRAAQYFTDYDHPNNRYFTLVFAEIADNGWYPVE